jgi:hypothetical protein
MPPTTDSTSLPASTGTATDRLVSMLADPAATFTRDQVAYLMGTAQRWGYEAREAEERDEWTALQARPSVQVMGRWYDQAAYRAKADAVARLDRVSDFQGGLPLPSTYMNEEVAA